MEVGGISRGDVVAAVIAGSHGKPRPALIIQSDAFRASNSVTLLPLTSDLRDAPPIRIDIGPTSENGLRTSSQIMIDKTATVRVQRIRRRVGRVDAATMGAVERALAQFLGLAEP